MEIIPGASAWWANFCNNVYHFKTFCMWQCKQLSKLAYYLNYVIWPSINANPNINDPRENIKVWAQAIHSNVSSDLKKEWNQCRLEELTAWKKPEHGHGAVRLWIIFWNSNKKPAAWLRDTTLPFKTKRSPVPQPHSTVTNRACIQLLKKDWNARYQYMHTNVATFGTQNLVI